MAISVPSVTTVGFPLSSTHLMRLWRRAVEARPLSKLYQCAELSTILPSSERRKKTYLLSSFFPLPLFRSCYHIILSLPLLSSSIWYSLHLPC